MAAAKSAGTTNGATWPQFLAQCRAQLGSGAPSPPLCRLPAPSLKQAPYSRGKSRPLLPQLRRLDGRWQPKHHETVWRAVASRKGGWNHSRRNLATIPEILPGAARLDDKRSAAGRICASSAGSCATSAPTQSGSLFPWQRPAAPPAGSAASTGSGSASAQEAQDRCPGSTVVWVNEHSHIYHFPGTRDYGHTKSGAYMCEAEAQTSGNRAAMNERHP